MPIPNDPPPHPMPATPPTLDPPFKGYVDSFSQNAATYYGGAIFNNGGTTSVTSSTFVGNATIYGLGGGIDNQGGNLTVTGSTFLDNSSFEGGAIFNRAGTTSVTTTTIMGNSAYQGGGLFNDGTGNALGTLTLTDSTLAGNSAFQGGAISNNFDGVMTIVASTLANNTATQYGGAIDQVGTLTVISGTIAYNVAVVGGISGGIDAYSGTTALYDTIVVLNTIGTGTNAPASDIVGSVSAASSYNLVGTGGLTNKVNNNLVGVTNPGLAATLANNGGPTETLALLTGSPAIGAGERNDHWRSCAHYGSTRAASQFPARHRGLPDPGHRHPDSVEACKP